MMTHTPKIQLRRSLRAARTELEASRWAQLSQRIVAQLGRHPALASADSVALFWPMIQRREVDVRALDPLLRQRRTALCYPYFRSGEMGFRHCEDPLHLLDNPWGFREPGPGCRDVVPGELDAIVLPALALTPEGQRLGYGAGFYDRMLALHPAALSIGTCFDFELLEQLPTEAHDRGVDWVVTDARTLAASSRARCWPGHEPPL